MSGLFSHLRVSSEYSITQGLLTIDQIVASAKKNSVPSVALTDQSNMFGLVKFFKKCEESGIKPISGASIRCIFDDEQNAYELLCLAKSNKGHKNLMKIISNAHNNLDFNGPIIKFSELKELSNDIIAVSGGRGSHIFEYLKRNNTNDAKQIINDFQKYFKDNFIIEVQRTYRPDEKEYFVNLLPLAEENGIALIATNDVLFSNKDDYEIHETKVCINTGKTLNDINREKVFSENQYFKSPSEMEDLFNDYPAIIDNTNEISKKCNVCLDTKGYFLPEYPVPKSHDFDSFIQKISEQRLLKYIENFESNNKKIYQQRLEYELEQIKNMGFSSYFLIVADFIEWSKKNDVPVGPGRGSGAGSLVAFALGITALDPIIHGLLFERFLNPERHSMPDFDIDICQEKRDLVIEYVSNKYGKDAVSQIATFGTMAARMVVRDVARALGKPYAVGDKISRMIPGVPGMTLDKAQEEQPIFKQTINEDEEVKEIVDLSYKLEGITRNVGKHAAGVVIAPGSISDFCPVYFDRQSNSTMTQFDKDDVEKIGLVKFDFLGLRTLTVIDKALKTINNNLSKDKQVDISKISLSDKKVFELLASGETMSVFQLESRGMRELIKKLKPTKFEEITALLALFRPGPLNSGMHEEFVNRKHGKSPVTYPHKLLQPVLEETYGVIVYQEQVMEAARVLAGFSLGQADILRRAMGKKKKEEMEEQREIFVKGCIENNITKNNAEQIFDLINQFAEYGFNKSHSAAYALISYQTAFLKTYYPAHFMAAVLSTELKNTDKIHALILECERMNIEVLQPNVLISDKSFSVNDDQKIEYGLGAIKGVSDAFIDHVCKKREGTDINDLWGFSRKIDIRMGGKKSLEALAFSGAFDSLVPSRSIAVECVPDMLADGNNQNNTGDLFDNMNDDFDPYERYVNTKELNLSEKLELERVSLGYYLSGHPVKAIEGKIKKIQSKKIKDLNSQKTQTSLIGLLSSIRNTRDRKGKPVAFVNFSDGTGSMDGIISGESLERCHHFLKEGKILHFSGLVETDDYRTNNIGMQMYKMRVNNVSTIEEKLNKNINEVIIDISKSQSISLDDFINKLESIDSDFWNEGLCRVNVRVKSNKTGVIIDIGDKFSFSPSLKNLFYLEDIFGKDTIEI